MRTISDNIVISSSELSTSKMFNRRQEKRLPIALTLYLRRLFNTGIYLKVVKTIDISANGLLISSKINLETGAEIEISNFNRDVVAKAVVKHSRKDKSTNQYKIGLEIVDKKTSWYVTESSNNNSLATTRIC